MAISNKFGLMLVTTGNKSEMSVGYATIYGDMNGGFNPIKDLYKMEVFRLAELRNRWKPKGALGPDGEVIARNILNKPPSAELRENQKDQDSLPPYEVLDAILEGLVEKEMRVGDVVAKGHDLETVRKIERLLYLAEYKRRQSAPGVKVTRQEFWPRQALSDRQFVSRFRRRPVQEMKFAAERCLFSRSRQILVLEGDENQHAEHGYYDPESALHGIEIPRLPHAEPFAANRHETAFVEQEPERQPSHRHALGVLERWRRGPNFPSHRQGAERAKRRRGGLRRDDQDIARMVEHRRRYRPPMDGRGGGDIVHVEHLGHKPKIGPVVGQIPKRDERHVEPDGGNAANFCKANGKHANLQARSHAPR